MALYQVIIAYDGTNFQGFQRQRNARTVQAVVENALRQLNWRDKAILYAGRTDSGVHALGQVIAFDLAWEHSPEALNRAMNAVLPEDVAVCQVRLADEGFHPRYMAIARRYHYQLYCQPVRNPLRERYTWRVWPAPDGRLLNQTADLLIGKHDFAAFGSPLTAGGSTIRTVLQAAWKESAPGEWSFRIVADAFLYRMVRRLVYLQVLVGQQRLALADFAAALGSPQPLMPGLAKPNGLFLERVYYDDVGLKSEGLF